MSSLLPVDQFFNHIIEIEDNGLVLFNNVLHLLLPLLFLFLQAFYFRFLALDDASIELDLHTCVALSYLHIRVAHLLQKKDQDLVVFYHPGVQTHHVAL